MEVFLKIKGITENFVKGETYSKITFDNLDKFKKGFI